MLTISIEDNAIKVLESRGNKVIRAIKQVLAEGIVKDGVVLDPQVLADVLKQILANNAIKDKNAVVAISGIHSLYRVIRLPRISKDLMEEAAKREMTRLFPIPLEQLYTAWQAIPGSPEEYIVPLLGVPKESIDFIFSALKQAGIDCKVMDLRPLAIARVCDEPTAIVINMQDTSYDIVILVDGIPELIRSVSFTGIGAGIAERVDELKEELDRTVNFYNSGKPKTPIGGDTPVFISGLFKDELKGVVGYPVRPLPSLMLYTPDFNEDEYVVNVGLALKRSRSGSHPVKVNLNLVPAEYLPKPVPVINVVSWLFLIVAAIVVIITIINFQQVAAVNAGLRSEIKQLNQQITTAQKNKAEIEQLQSQKNARLAEKESIEKLFNSLSSQKSKLNSELGVIVGSLTGKMSFSSIIYDGIWKVSGNAPDADSIISYVYTLQNSKQFSSVNISNMREVSFANWSFNINLTGNP